MQTPKITTKLPLFGLMLLLLLPFASNLYAFPDQQKFTIPLSASNGGAEAAAITPNGRFLGVISSSSGSYVSIIDTSLFAVTATVSVGSTPTGIVASDDSRFFYVTTSAANGVYEI